MHVDSALSRLSVRHALLAGLLLGPGLAQASLPAEDERRAARRARTQQPVPAALRKGEPVRRRAPRLRPPRAGEATAPLEGALFYEDHRRHGRHVTRRDLRGDRGRGDKARERRAQDFLGAFYAVVDVYEVDPRGALGPGCSRLEWVGAATVDRDGSFRVEVPAEDRCSVDDGTPPEYAVRARTRYCRDELCFKVGPTRPSAYTLWYGLDAPMATGPEGQLRRPLLFSPEGKPNRNDWSRAANHYAGLVDAVVALHLVGGLPFRREEFGPVTVRYPSPFASGRATAADLIDADNGGWPKGNLILHEYGHIVHRRAWGGDYAGFHKPIQRWSGKRPTKEVPFIAMKEGWANFVTNYVTGRCFRARYDEGSGPFTSEERGLDGIHFPQNHHRLFCDWVDERDDQRPGTDLGDHVQISIFELWTALDRTDDNPAGLDLHEPVHEGLDLCDLMAVHLDGAPAERVWEVAGLLQTNHISCPAVTRRVQALGPPPAVSPPASSTGRPPPPSGSPPP